ncbi:MAG TPA: NAD(P)-binding domain-containing protein, partial [Acidimicrobiales bacterium]|nr:NAD(P)-binding domain-containing protein [Acidimicrobiales bacterium]
MSDAQPQRQRLGFVGLGNIGGALCANLLTDGHELVVHDVDPVRVEALTGQGARAAESPAVVAGQSELTFLSLPSPSVMESVTRQWLEGTQGGAQGGKVLVDLSTNAPATVQQMGAVVSEAGSSLVEAPLTGGAPGARSRQLVFIVGGDDEV